MAEKIGLADTKTHSAEHRLDYTLTDVLQWQSLLSYTLDVSRWISIGKQPWEKAPHAIPVIEEACFDNVAQLLGNGIFRTLRTAGLPPIQSADGLDCLTAFGGPCLLTTGDLAAIAHHDVWAVIEYINTHLPRLDQVIDAVGVTNLDQALIIFEDDLFLNLLKRNFWYELIEPEEQALSKALQELALRTFDLISHWLTISQGKRVKAQPIFTSQIHSQLVQDVIELADIIQIPRLAQSDKATVELTYTGLFQATAATNGFIHPDQTLLCAEPYDHFTICKTTGSGIPFDRREALTPFYQQNLFGMPGHNKKMAVAGFIPMFSSTHWSKNIPCSEVINQDNITLMLQYYKQSVDGLLNSEGSYMPFPLGQNPIFTLALNLLFWDSQSRQTCHFLKSLSDEYYQKKKGQDFTYELKQNYRKRAHEPMRLLVAQIELILESIGFIKIG